MLARHPAIRRVLTQRIPPQPRPSAWASSIGLNVPQTASIPIPDSPLFLPARSFHTPTHPTIPLTLIRRGVSTERPEIQEITTLANNGDVEAQHSLGLYHAVEKDDIGEARKWWLKAASAGYASSQYCVGNSYISGGESDVDVTAALEWWQKAAEQGHGDAIYNIAVCFENGDGVPIDMDKAAQYFRKGAQLGHPGSEYGLGLCYLEGRGVDASQEEAMKWIKAAAELGHVEAQAAIGELTFLNSQMSHLGEMQNIFEKMDIPQPDFEAELDMPGRLPASPDIDFDAFANAAPSQESQEAMREAVQWWQEAASQGHPDAIYHLANCYASGDVLAKDEAKAVNMWTEAAEQGHPEAQYELANVYAEGKGVPKDMEKAIHWYNLSSKQNSMAAFELAEIFLNGYGVQSDEAQAVKYFEMAADRDMPEAIVRLGEIYMQKAQEQQSEECQVKAFKAFKRAADLEHPMGMAQVGVCHMHGLGVDTDEAEAEKWWRKGAEIGEPYCHQLLGELYLTKGTHRPVNYREAAKFLRVSADSGHMESQLALGTLYMDGVGVKKNIERAIQFFQMAAEQKSGLAWYSLGMLYDSGDGVPQDQKKAFECWEQGAELDHPESQHNLACCYMDGSGVEKNPKQAFRWFTKAAKQADYPQSYIQLGLMYAEGIGVEASPERAVGCLKKAVEAGSEDAKKILEQLMSQVPK